MNENVYKYDEMKRREHMAVRTNVGWYLWTHQIMEVTGEDAAAFLDYLYPNNISNLKPGRERYTTMLNERAEIIDDVVIFRMDENRFWVSTLFVHYLKDWFDRHKGSYRVTYQDITSAVSMYAVQGPKSKDMVNALVKENVDDMKFFSFVKNEIAGMQVMVNRAGYTGEKLGYEIYCAAENSDLLEEKIREAGKAFEAVEVTEFQIMAWTLPCEAGFLYMRDLRHTNPLEVGLARGINYEKEFIGKEALIQIRENGAARELVGFTVDEADVFIHSKHLGGPGEAVIFNGEEVGRVSKLVYSYVLDKNIGYLLVKKGCLKPGDKVLLHGYEAEIHALPFI